jgi:hypothetical protein
MSDHPTVKRLQNPRAKDPADGVIEVGADEFRAELEDSLRTGSSDLPMLDIRKVRNEPPPAREYLFKDGRDGVAPSGVGCGIGGGGGVGKSTVIASLCVSLATLESRWLGRYEPVKRQHVHYWTSEDDADELHRRLKAICKDLSPRGWDFLEEYLHVYPIMGHEFALTAPDGAGGFLRGHGAGIAMEHVERHGGGGVVLFDPLRKMTAGAEDGAALNAVVLTLDWMRGQASGELSTFVSHHSSKQSIRTGESGAEALRGATDLVDGLRWVMTMSRLDPAVAKKFRIPNRDRGLYRRFDFPKSNYSVEQREMYLKWSEGQFLAVDLHADEVDPIPALLRVMRLLGEPVTANSLRDHCRADADGDGQVIPVAQKRVGEVLIQALDGGLIRPAEAPKGAVGRNASAAGYALPPAGESEGRF